MQELARIILRRYGGRVPRTKEELLELPGVGVYTAEIVLAVSFGHDVLAVDVNVARPFKRMGLAMDDKEVKSLLLHEIPRGQRTAFSKILLEFGMTICKPVKPLCVKCPVADLCDYSAP